MKYKFEIRIVEDKEGIGFENGEVVEFKTFHDAVGYLANFKKDGYEAYMVEIDENDFVFELDGRELKERASMKTWKQLEAQGY